MASGVGVVSALRPGGERVAELRQDGVLALGALLLAEGGERALLVGGVDLVLLADAHGLHAPVAAAAHHVAHRLVRRDLVARQPDLPAPRDALFFFLKKLKEFITDLCIFKWIEW